MCSSTHWEVLNVQADKGYIKNLHDFTAPKKQAGKACIRQ